MARFLISPGVITREVDNSQYAATIPAGNVAALVGYAEKGPFEPTLVSGPQEFNDTFGKTLEDSPYLAQAAYKYFEQADQLLVVRAGDNRDPDAYPQAAQYASKSVRLGASTSPATAGTQAFSAASDVAGGTYAPNASYGFSVVVDHRAFASPMYLERWTGVAAETSAPAGMNTETSLTVVKMAAASASSNSGLMFNYKREHSGAGVGEYQGSGQREGTNLGDSVDATLTQYRSGGTYADDPSDYIVFNGHYGAALLGDVDLQGGATFAGENFVLTLGGTDYTITPSANTYADAAAVVAELNAQLVNEGIDDHVEAFAMTGAVSGESYIGLRHIDEAATPVDGMTLAAGTPDALAMLGWVAGTYDDDKAIFGTWNAGNPVAPGQAWTGNFIFRFESSTASAESFEDPIEISLTAPAAGNWTLSSIAAAIDAELDDAYDGAHSSLTDFWGNPLAYSYTEARGSAAVNTDGRVAISAMEEAEGLRGSVVRLDAPSAGNSLVDLLGGAMTAQDGSAESSVGDALIMLQAAEKGSYGNNLIFRVEEENVQTGATTTVTRYNIYVLWNGKEVSVYRRLAEEAWTDPMNENFIPTLLAEDPYVRVEAEDEDGNSTMAVLPAGDWQLGTGDLPDGVLSTEAEIAAFNEGTNGWTEDAGSITSMSADLINALQKIYNPEVWDFNLVAAPGDSTPQVQNAVQSLCESRRDCFGIVDAAEFGIGLGITQGTNHVSEVTDACATLNSSYVGAYWPWLQDYDSDNQQYVWLPPSIYALKQMVYTDAIADPWFAPAGTRRGKISAVDVEYSPSRTDRDLLYGDLNIVNPIVKFVNEGIVIWGQKTAQRTRSALDRINVRRLLIYAEKLVARMARGFLFEPHDEANWAAFARQANAILEPIRQRRGLYSYQVVCDATTNTADLINQNIMAGKIFVQPTKTIEFIEVEFTINAAGEVTITE